MELYDRYVNAYAYNIHTNTTPLWQASTALIYHSNIQQAITKLLKHNMYLHLLCC